MVRSVVLREFDRQLGDMVGDTAAVKCLLQCMSLSMEKGDDSVRHIAVRRGTQGQDRRSAAGPAGQPD